MKRVADHQILQPRMDADETQIFLGNLLAWRTFSNQIAVSRPLSFAQEVNPSFLCFLNPRFIRANQRLHKNLRCSNGIGIETQETWA